MVSALTAAVFSSAKADITVSGSAGVHVTSGGNVLDGTAPSGGTSRSTSGTLFMNGAGVSFAMSTTTAGGMTVSSSGGITLDSNDADNTKGVSGLASVSFASDGFTFTIGDVDLVGDSTGEVGNVASALLITVVTLLLVLLLVLLILKVMDLLLQHLLEVHLLA